MKRVIFIFFLISLQIACFSQVRKILFIGNSYTNTNQLPATLQEIALSLGDSIIFDSSTPGGATFEMHSANSSTLSKITSTEWDYVVLQEQSQRPSFPPSQVETEVYPYAQLLDSVIKENYSCTRTMFFMTWGRKNGDAANCASYPPLCTYEGMQARLRESYLQMSQMYDAELSPVGAVWSRFRQEFPQIELYATDESHPNENGSYLAACTFYSSIFHKSPLGSFVPASVDATVAENIHNIVAQVVLDSIDNWNIDTTNVYAGFYANGMYPVKNNQINAKVNTAYYEFQNTSIGATSYLWDFGDGNSSNLESPNHTYSDTGTYVVKLYAYNECKADSANQEIEVELISSGPSYANPSIELYPVPAKFVLYIEFPAGVSTSDFNYSVYSMDGTCHLTGELDPVVLKINTTHLENGVYTLHLVSPLHAFDKKFIIRKEP